MKKYVVIELKEGFLPEDPKEANSVIDKIVKDAWDLEWAAPDAYVVVMDETQF